MKCPRCDTDTTGKRKCSKCGLDASPQEEIEVEYKDFKTLELLEIRRKKQAAHGYEEIKAVREHKEETLHKDDKKPFPFLVAMALVLMLIAGVFLIFRYFIIL